MTRANGAHSYFDWCQRHSRAPEVRLHYEREPRMTLTQLEHVLAAHQAGSFSRAARACGVTQAALSNSVAKLEDELGDRIFSRTTRQIALTPFGQRLLPHIEQILGGRDALLGAAK